MLMYLNTDETLPGEVEGSDEAEARGGGGITGSGGGSSMFPPPDMSSPLPKKKVKHQKPETLPRPE